MLYMIYDAGLLGGAPLFAFKQNIPNGQMLLHHEFDKDLEWAAPWIFPITEEHLEWLSNEHYTTSKFLWFESTATQFDLVQAFRKIIYNNDPEHATSFFRCWDLNVLLDDLRNEKSRCKYLFQFIDHLYLIRDEDMQAYYLDYWGVLNVKSMTHFNATKQ